MTLQELILATGRDRSELARLLGYRSENSLRQMESGKQALPAAKAAWLERYAKHRRRLAKAETEWLEKNPVA
jgi:hypothetical protein